MGCTSAAQVGRKVYSSRSPRSIYGDSNVSCCSEDCCRYEKGT